MLIQKQILLPLIQRWKYDNLVIDIMKVKIIKKFLDNDEKQFENIWKFEMDLFLETLMRSPSIKMNLYIIFTLMATKKNIFNGFYSLICKYLFKIVQMEVKSKVDSEQVIYSLISGIFAIIMSKL